MQLDSREFTERVGCDTEYEKLKRVIVCSPRYMRIGKIINETQKHYKSENIDVDIAMKQHETFVQTLKSYQVEVVEMTPHQDLYEQVFTRDIGFCIGKNLYTANMGQRIRVPEVQQLETYLNNGAITYHSIDTDSIEGGDVIVDGQTIWIGISDRTSKEAVEKLQEQLPNYQINPLPIDEHILHLDCAFNCIAPNMVLVYPKAFAEKELEKIRQHYEYIIEVSEDEAFTLGTNVFMLDHKTVISLPENQQVNQQLRAHDFYVIEVPFNEIIKSGGSFRCCTLPVLRENS
ncbi:dimethylarginine dimethylaminohydrolase family protein [Paraliobacillus ryukyuensis]|uniref:dimethylarginine dimethylaminohydrolase family protein n=1 Tax=Paraliobacillus ryukyuensis TaxID=200904 RepID=UPI002119636B|nr:arginine deiminase family protein [Paraliobacillus ryukyuensis]